MMRRVRGLGGTPEPEFLPMSRNSSPAKAKRRQLTT